MKLIAKKVLIVMFCMSLTLINVGVYATTGNEVNNGQINNGLQTGYEGNLKTDLEVKILPTINSSVIVTIDKDTEFHIIDTINKWCHIQTENCDGWVLISKLEGTNSETTAGENENEVTNSNETTANNSSNETASNETENNSDNETASNETNNTNNSANNQSNETEKQGNNTPSTTSKVTKYVSTETLNVRETPDSDARILRQISVNDKVTLIEEVDETWAKIETDGLIGYVSSKYLSDKKVSTSSRSSTVERRATNRNIEKDTVSSNIENNGSNQNSGYQESAASRGNGSDIVAFAKQFLGYKYVSGGSLPSVGFDCSGFTSYVYSHFGISISRTTAGQNTNGVYVNKNNLQLGDIVVFRNRANTAVGHVGIYIGGNSFIHAENSKTGVVIGYITSSYYGSRYVGARRVI